MMTSQTDGGCSIKQQQQHRLLHTSSRIRSTASKEKTVCYYIYLDFFTFWDHQDPSQRQTTSHYLETINYELRQDGCEGLHRSSFAACCRQRCSEHHSSSSRHYSSSRSYNQPCSGSSRNHSSRSNHPCSSSSYHHGSSSSNHPCSHCSHCSHYSCYSHCSHYSRNHHSSSSSNSRCSHLDQPADCSRNSVGRAAQMNLVVMMQMMG